MYAIVKTGGKQYRVEQGQSLLVERLPVEGGGNATLQPLLYVDGDNIVDGEGLEKVTIQARVVGHERGPKLRVVKFKPKRGYKRRTGHRQDLTRIEVTEIKLAGGRGGSRRAPKPVAAEGAEADATKDATAQAPATAAATEAAAKPGRRRAPAKAESEASAKGAKAGDGAGEAKSASRKRSGDTEAAEAPAKPARPRRKPAAGESKPEEADNGS